MIRVYFKLSNEHQLEDAEVVKATDTIGHEKIGGILFPQNSLFLTIFLLLNTMIG